MILSGSQIVAEVARGSIIIDPVDSKQVNPNSYDLRLGSSIIFYEEPILDTRRPNRYRTVEIPDAGLVLEKGSFCLGASIERIGGLRFVPIIHAKSSVARMGLFVHITADLIDIGSIGNITFQLHATESIRIYVGQRLAQVSFWEITGDVSLYSGKYQNSTGPQVSRGHLSNEL